MLQRLEAAGTPQAWYRTADWILRVALFVYLAGLAIGIYARMGTSLGGVALMDWSVPHGTIAIWERTIATILLIGGLSLLVYPLFPVALLIGAAIAIEAYAAYSFGGEAFSEWSLYARSLRYLLPVALAVLLLPAAFGLRERGKALASMWILRVAIAVVFATHGWQALSPEGRYVFVDLLIGSSRTLLGYRLTESVAIEVLKVIGVVDLIVAAAILVGRWRPLLAWLCFWGTITAFSRVTALGWASYGEVLSRAAHITAPVVVWTLAVYQERTATAHDTSTAGADASAPGGTGELHAGTP